MPIRVLPLGVVVNLHLLFGDEMGVWVKVLSIIPLEGEATVYNFEVENDHDYFVGEIDTIH